LFLNLQIFDIAASENDEIIYFMGGRDRLILGAAILGAKAAN
jgi:hypothetical protein